MENVLCDAMLMHKPDLKRSSFQGRGKPCARSVAAKQLWAATVVPIGDGHVQLHDANATVAIKRANRLKFVCGHLRGNPTLNVHEWSKPAQGAWGALCADSSELVSHLVEIVR
eukprot:4715754-Alexandrium_andersonii.AAC.1